MFVGVAALVALLVTYPYGTLTLVTLFYLAAIPISYRRYQLKLQEPAPQPTAGAEALHLPGRDPDRRSARRRDQALIRHYAASPAPADQRSASRVCD